MPRKDTAKPQIALLCLMLFVFGFRTDLASGQMVMQEKSAALCAGIQIKSYEPIELSKAEKNIICGEPGNPGWQKIPNSQAIFFLKKSLTKRGYWDHTIAETKDEITVNAGAKKTLKSIGIKGSPVEISVDRYWYPIGRPLTTDLLDEIENWTREQLSAIGYPCALIRALASTTSGEVEITVDPGNKWIVSDLRSEGIIGKLGGVERRYDAFSLGETYDATKFSLTTQRLVSNDLVVSSAFVPVCGKPETVGRVDHTLAAGPPREVSIAFGFDTEEFFIARTEWKNGRLFPSASPLGAAAHASYIKQRASVNWDFYYLPFASRHFIGLFGGVSRTNEKASEEITARSSALPTWQMDVKSLFVEGATGVAIENISTPRGLAKRNVRLAIWESSLKLMTHDFEFFRSSPRSGHQFSIRTVKASESLGSNVSLSSAKLDTTHLWNIGGWAPPIFILGIRSSFASTIAGVKTEPEDLPTSYRFYLGGNDNLRGFGRNALPNNSLGAMSFGYLGTELRFNNILPYKFQPFFFTDAARLGTASMKLDGDSTYWSPGAGMRWESPVGSMRMTLGQGIIEGQQKERLAYLSRWQFYFSFGDQF